MCFTLTFTFTFEGREGEMGGDVAKRRLGML